VSFIREQRAVYCAGMVRTVGDEKSPSADDGESREPKGKILERDVYQSAGKIREDRGSAFRGRARSISISLGEDDER